MKHCLSTSFFKIKHQRINWNFVMQNETKDLMKRDSKERWKAKRHRWLCEFDVYTFDRKRKKKDKYNSLVIFVSPQGERSICSDCTIWRRKWQIHGTFNVRCGFREFCTHKTRISSITFSCLCFTVRLVNPLQPLSSCQELPTQLLSFLCLSVHPEGKCVVNYR